jgi:hypothetical protein
MRIENDLCCIKLDCSLIEQPLFLNWTVLILYIAYDLVVKISKKAN